MSAKTQALNMWPIPENSLQKDPVIDQNAEATAQAMVGIVTLNLIADANYTLLPADYRCAVLVITDSGVVLTTGRDLIFPALFARMTVINSTAQTLTLKMAGQTGITLAGAASTTIVAGPVDVIQAAVSGGGGGGGVTYSVQTVVSAATVTPVATNDKVVISAQAAALTIANPSGTAADGQGFVIALKDDGTARSITMGADYRGFSAARPTTTIAGKWMLIPVMRNQTDSKWDVLTVSNQL